MTRREQILESAFNAFTSKGIKVVKMEDIAGSLKISKKTLYEFFSGKKELLVASMEYKIPKLLEKNSKIVRCMPNPLTAMVFCAVENIRFMSSFSESFVDEVRAVPELKDFGGNVKNEMDSLMNTMLSQCVREGYLKEEDSKRLVSVFMDNLRNFKELRNQDVFPSQLCFNIVITILGGLCTQKGKKVLDELKENYS
ncbi:MAG: TetR/AcrR family transcriptional regulator [Bacteroidales bacterium]|nr:TetR/AcrR family transcriptional regulator [Bacteroidales bacterium]